LAIIHRLVVFHHHISKTTRVAPSGSLN